MNQAETGQSVRVADCRSPRFRRQRHDEQDDVGHDVRDRATEPDVPGADALRCRRQGEVPLRADGLAGEEDAEELWRTAPSAHAI